MHLLKRYNNWEIERIGRHILYWASWSIFFIVVNNWAGKAIDYQHDPTRLRQWIAFESVVLPVKISSTYTIAYILMPKLLYRKKFLAFIIATFVVLFLFACLLLLVYKNVIYPVILNSNSAYSANQFIYKGLELVYIASLVVAIKFFQNFLAKQEENQRLIQEKVEAELKYLKNQIQPHFLFNTLNNIYGMILSQDEKAAETVVKLSDLLSYMLYESNVRNITLCKEINQLNSFIELESVRYERKLDLTYTQNIINSQLKIAPLLLIPFVENAFKHGPGKSDQNSFVYILIETQANELYFTVENSYARTSNHDKLQSGIGLENIQKRLELLYPNRHSLNIIKTDSFLVKLMIELTE